MRKLAVFLMLLAAGKIATLEWLHRSATDDVVINAYRPRALDACSTDARRLAGTGGDTAWSSDTQIRLEVGMRDRDVRIWQVDNPAWSARFRNPYLHLEAGPPAARLRCEYDIINGTATASKV